MTNTNLEILEAVRAADQALHYLNKAKKSLDKAQGWGVVDLLGGKKVITFLKQRRIQNAEMDLTRAKVAIDKLNKEVRDVEAIVDVDLNMGIVLKLADFFFGGAIADWIVLGRIGEAKLKISQASSQIRETKVKLEKLLKEY